MFNQLFLKIIKIFKKPNIQDTKEIKLKPNWKDDPEYQKRSEDYLNEIQSKIDWYLIYKSTKTFESKNNLHESKKD